MPLLAQHKEIENFEKKKKRKKEKKDSGWVCKSLRVNYIDWSQLLYF